MLFRLRLLGQAVLLLVVAASLIFLFSGKELKNTPLEAAPVEENLGPRHDVLLGLGTEGDEDSDLQPQEAVPLSSQENDLLYRPPLDIALIFTHAKDNAPFQYKLRVAVGSLLQAASAPLRLHLITDDDGFHIASQIINDVQSSNQLDSRYVKVRTTTNMRLNFTDPLS